MKVVINRRYGGFGISAAAVLRMRELGSDAAKKEVMKGEKWPYTNDVNDREWGSYRLNDLPRHDPILVRVVEEMKVEANGSYAQLAVIEIPDGVDYEIDEYDGMEHIAEKHRTWP